MDATVGHSFLTPRPLQIKDTEHPFNRLILHFSIEKQLASDIADKRYFIIIE